jgi:3-oxoacyl-[acyl-carrier protein] reductase
MVNPGLQDQVAVVTGGNTGIGRAISEALGSQGMRVVVHYLESVPKSSCEPGYTPHFATAGREATDAVVEQIRRSGSEACAVSGDLADPGTIARIFDYAQSSFGSVSVLVNNAAHCELPDTILSTSLSSIDRHFRINTAAPVVLMSEFARRFRARNLKAGSIINVSTDAAQVFPNQIAYGASKAALEAFTRSIAIELGPYGIRVNTVAPGPIQTGWIDAELEARVLPSIPLGRLGAPEDIADAVVFLASRQASWISGQVIKVSGGHAL